MTIKGERFNRLKQSLGEHLRFIKYLSYAHKNRTFYVKEFLCLSYEKWKCKKKKRKLTTTQIITKTDKYTVGVFKVAYR